MSGRDGIDTIPARLQANAARPDVADFLRLLHADGRDESFSYRELLDRAAGFASLFHGAGLKRGDRVAIVLRHSADLYASFTGALLGGFVPSVWSHPSPKVSPQVYLDMLRAFLASGRPRLVVTWPDLQVSIENEARAAGAQVCTPANLSAAERADLLALTRPNDIAFLQYSSGTTGTRKGVAISHRALLWQIDRYAEAIRLSPDDRIVSWLPLYHDMGLIACFMLPLLRRVPIVAMCPFEWVRQPAMWLHAVSRHRATVSWLPNFAYSFLARTASDEDMAGVDLSCLRAVINCSEPVLHASHEQFTRRFAGVGLRPAALAACYAMAENTFAVTASRVGAPPVMDHIDAAEFARTGAAVPVPPDAPFARTLVSSGAPLPETEVAIVDDAGRPLPERQLGEIVIRTPCLFTEYDHNDEATRQALREGRCFTGDAGYLAAGQLFVTGRRKDMLIIRGQNTYPQDIEAIVSEVAGVIPGRVAAVGVPNEQAGTEDLVILAETHETNTARRDEIRGEIIRRVSQATEVNPSDVCLLEHMWLRKSTSGKISRQLNRDRYLAGDLAAGRNPAPAVGEGRDGEDEMLGRVRGAIHRVLVGRRRPRVAPPGDDDPLISSGLVDSLALVELISAIEAACEVSVPPSALTEVNKMDTPRQWAALVARLRAAGPPQPDVATWPCRPDQVPLVIDGQRAARRSVGFWSHYYRWVFRRRGMRVGRGLRVLGPLLLRFDGDPRNVVIGDNVTIMPGVDLKVRENGRIVLHDGVVLDTNVRLVAANDARIELGNEVQIAMGTIINAGEDVIIGRRTAVAGYCTIIASEHRYLGREPFMQQGYLHDPVYIGQDVWLAANVFVGRGSRIGDGAVVGVQSVVRGDLPARCVAMGNPARVVRFREALGAPRGGAPT